MKTKKSKILLAMLGITLNSYAETFPPSPQRAFPPVGAPVPIDSEIWILLISGVVLGIFFLFRKPKSTA